MNKLLLTLKIAFKGLFTNKARSVLTTLGIVIGIASVITLMSLGSGAKQDIEEGLAALVWI